MDEKTSIQLLYQRTVLPNLFILSDRLVDLEVLSFIMNKTLRFGKLSEQLKPFDLKRGTPEAFLPPVLTTNPSSIRRSRLRLVEQKLIYYKCDHLRTCSPATYEVNLLGICATIFYAYGATQGDLVDHFEFVIAKFAERGMEVDHIKPVRSKVMQIKDAIEQGNKKSLDAILKKKAKPLNSSNIRKFIGSACEREGVTYYEGEAWTKRRIGNAKYFIKECKDRGVDPKDVLRDVISKWERIRGKAVSIDGKNVPMPSTFSFGNFFPVRDSLIQLAMSGVSSKKSTTASGRKYKYVEVED